MLHISCRTAAVIAVLLLAVLGCADRVAAPITPSPGSAAQLTSLGFVILPRPSEFVDSIKYALSGRRTTDGACVWSGQRLLARGQRIAERVAAYHPLSCELVIARGAFQPADTVRMQSKVDRFSSRSSATQSSAFNYHPQSMWDQFSPRRSSAGIAASDYYGNPDNCQPPSIDIGRARQVTRFRDPIFITTTRDELYLQWNYNWQCVGHTEGYHDMQWFAGSGWNRGAWETYPLAFDYNLYWALGKGNSFYYNSSFPGCAATVYANHSQNWVYGFDDGVAAFNWDINLLGSNCQVLLTPVVEQENLG